MNGRELERFSIPNLLKCENRDSGEIICGYGILWGQPSSDLGGFVRMFMPGCFTESLASQEVRYLYAHDDDQIYGRTANGTLKVTEDEKGLWVELTPPVWSPEFVGRIRSGLVDGQSVGVFVTQDVWTEATDTEPAVRHINKATLIEVSATANPAFPSTTLELRTLSSMRATRQQPSKSPVVLLSLIQQHAEIVLGLSR